MGKKIDYFVLTAGITAGLYLFLRSTLQNQAAAIALSLLCCFLLNRVFRHISNAVMRSSYLNKRRIRKSARSALMYLACMDEAEARDKLTVLIKKIYGFTPILEFLQFHPASCIRENDVFSCWKRCRGKDKLVICTTSQADSAVHALASELRQPKISLIDADALAQLIAECPDGLFPEHNEHHIRRLKRRHLQDLIINRKNVPRCVAMFFSMLLIYIFSANAFYLGSALFVLFVALASLHKKGRPAKLF